MSIRIRTVESVTVALCAARSVPKEGDLYLDDGAHHALSVKFSLDFAEMFDRPTPYAGSDEAQLMEREESDNPNRAAWDEWMRAK